MNFQTNLIPKRKTKGIYLFLLSAFVFISYLIVWLLIGEIDLLKKQWFITPFVYQENDVWVTRKIYFNPIIAYIWIGLILFWISFFIIFKWILHKINWDMFPFIFMTNMMGIALFYTGFIPYTASNSIWIIIARFIIIGVIGLASFLFTNFFVTSYLLKSGDASYIYEEIKSEYKQLKKIKDENEQFLNSKNKKDESYIDIEE